MTPKLSIIVPIWNEQHTLSALMHRIDVTMRNADISYEIIAIDDHSTDGSHALLQNLSTHYPIHIFKKEGKRGKAQSLLEGFDKAKAPIIAMIDADLQYPPEAFSHMFEKIQNGSDVVVANRAKRLEPAIRRFIGESFKFVFVRLLHKLKIDAQSGQKMFRREVLERVQIDPSPWSFDLEFLLAAQDAGYRLDSHNITFERRRAGDSKINVFFASLQIGLSALNLKFRNNDVIPFLKARVEKTGHGFTYRGQEYTHHTTLHPRETAFHRFGPRQKIMLSACLALYILMLIINFQTALILLIGAITFIYFLQLFFDFYLIQKGYRKQPEIHISQAQLGASRRKAWPKYTILCPLYKEWQVLPQFVTAMSKLDYPKDKLQILLLLEEDDRESIQHIQEYARKLPRFFKIVIVPDSLPKTKPKACNYGLLQATGEFVVIYDAEDVPDPKQLKKAVLAFEGLDPKTICLQAKLNFYNPHHNILTRIFTAEYSLWFDLVLTGMQSIETPIPLGGTSNHFRVSKLRQLHAWDAFNVTEDADLGIRIAKRGYRTAILDSVTLEEANSHFMNWINQRTRWIKGYLQTYFVHTRDLSMFRLATRRHQRYTFQLVIGAKILSTLVNPFMWATTIAYFAFRPYIGTTIESFFPPAVYYMGVFCFIFGNFLYLYYYMIGCAKRGHYELIKYAYLVPFYWLSMSYAGWLAVISLIREPHYWHKTVHGLHYNQEHALEQSMQHIGRDLIDRKLVGQHA